MEAFFAKIGRPMRANNRKQAELPQGSLPLENPNGTAPGFIAFSREGKFVACMPGVPREMKPMLTNAVVPFLRERLHASELIVTRVIHTIGLGESEIDHRIGDLFRSCENPKIAVLAHDFRADVKIMAKSASADTAEHLIEPLEHEIERRLAGSVFGIDDETPASAILRALRARGAHLALAESCTGGRIAAALTSVPGASESFAGAIVAYDNAVKISELDVAAETLAALRRGQRRIGARDGGGRAVSFANGCGACDHRRCRSEGRNAGEAGRFGVDRAGRRALGGARLALHAQRRSRRGRAPRDDGSAESIVAPPRRSGAVTGGGEHGLGGQALVEGRQPVGFTFDSFD